MSRRPPPGGREAILYTRPQCPSCFRLRRAAARAARRRAVPLRVVDVSGDPALMGRYGNEVPVLVLPGGRALDARASTDQVERAFRETARAVAVAGGRGRVVEWLRRALGRRRRAGGPGAET